MAKKNLSRKTRDAYERLIAKVEEERSQPFTEADIERILDEMGSEDEVTRAHAVRRICPCRMSPDIFYRLRKAAKRLQKDPSPLVRANAFHVEEDAKVVESIESIMEQVKDYEEQLEIDGEAKRRRKGPRSACP